jgi:regulatory protein YycH of two-component signal transduction system YycFG
MNMSSHNQALEHFLSSNIFHLKVKIVIYNRFSQHMTIQEILFHDASTILTTPFNYGVRQINPINVGCCKMEVDL